MNRCTVPLAAMGLVVAATAFGLVSGASATASPASQSKITISMGKELSEVDFAAKHFDEVDPVLQAGHRVGFVTFVGAGAECERSCYLTLSLENGVLDGVWHFESGRGIAGRVVHGLGAYSGWSGAITTSSDGSVTFSAS
ncbi:MAG TPA: hypothetical protein VHW74_09190 [Mycobacteriales bacterium]|nr:hypothetical protein [Mycobacteriales bacterium]